MSDLSKIDLVSVANCDVKWHTQETTSNRDEVNFEEVRHKTLYNPFSSTYGVLDLSRMDKNDASAKELIDTLVLSDNAKKFVNRLRQNFTIGINIPSRHI